MQLPLPNWYREARDSVYVRFSGFCCCSVLADRVVANTDVILILLDVTFKE